MHTSLSRIDVRSTAVLGLRPPACQAGDQDEQIEQSVRLQENVVLSLSYRIPTIDIEIIIFTSSGVQDWNWQSVRSLTIIPNVRSGRVEHLRKAWFYP